MSARTFVVVVALLLALTAAIIVAGLAIGWSCICRGSA